MPNGVVLSMDAPHNKHRRPTDYSAMAHAEYTTFHRDVNQFADDKDTTDPRFHSLVQEDIIESMVFVIGKLSPQHRVNMDCIHLK